MTVWVGFGFNVKLQLYMWDGTVNADRIIDALESEIEPYFDSIGDESYSLCQDNAPVHEAALTQNWLQEKKIHTVKIPPYSPDLNPCEHGLAMLCRHVYENGRQYRCVADLKSAIKNSWRLLNQEGLNQAINSMPKRLAAVIERRGGPTDY